MSIGSSGRASSNSPWCTASRGARSAISSASRIRVSTPRAAISGGQPFGGGGGRVEANERAARRAQRRGHTVKAVDAHDVRGSRAAPRRPRGRLVEARARAASGASGAARAAFAAGRAWRVSAGPGPPRRRVLRVTIGSLVEAERRGAAIAQPPARARKGIGI